MPDLFSPYTLKGVTLRNRIAMSPMTMYRSVDGKMSDFHVMLMGSRAAGGFGWSSRTNRHHAGWSHRHSLRWHLRRRPDRGPVARHRDHQGHGRRRPHPAGSHRPQGQRDEAVGGQAQLPPDHPDGWQVRGPSAITYGGRYTYPVHALTIDEIRDIHRAYADAARRALEAGFQWLEMHFAHGYLGASFFSPLANQRTDEYGGSP